MRCDECGYASYTTCWDWYWGAYLCDYCVEDLDYEEYLYLKRKRLTYWYY